MLYDDDIDDGERCSGDSRGGDGDRRRAHELLEDLTALLDAGLIVPVRGDDGQVRVTPAEPLAWKERSCS